MEKSTIETGIVPNILNQDVCTFYVMCDVLDTFYYNLMLIALWMLQLD